MNLSGRLTAKPEMWLSLVVLKSQSGTFHKKLIAVPMLVIAADFEASDIAVYGAQHTSLLFESLRLREIAIECFFEVTRPT
jgi:hypothetical protein